MESISNLNRVWRAQTHTVSDAETTVTRDDVGTWMFAKARSPGLRTHRRATRQSVGGLPGRRAADHSPVVDGVARNHLPPTPQALHSRGSPGSVTDDAGYPGWSADPRPARVGLRLHRQLVGRTLSEVWSLPQSGGRSPAGGPGT